MWNYLPTTLGLLDYILYNKNVCGLMIFSYFVSLGTALWMIILLKCK